MSAAAAAADAALADVEPLLFATIDEPVTEADVRNELEYRMRLHGADDRSYETIVAAGPDHGARPHHEPSGRTIVEGDTVIIDVGALVDGYHSDMTRSYVIGEPTPQQRELYELVSTSQHAGIAAIAGATQLGAQGARTIDAASRAVFDDAGYLDWYLHGTGHGVGPGDPRTTVPFDGVGRRDPGRQRGDRRTWPLSWRLRWIPDRGPPRRHRTGLAPTHPRARATIPVNDR